MSKSQSNQVGRNYPPKTNRQTPKKEMPFGGKEGGRKARGKHRS